MSRTLLRRVSIFAVLASVAGILLLTLTPLGAGPAGAWGDVCALGVPCSLGHAAAFLVLGMALAGWYATSQAARRSPARILVMLLLGLWIFAALDEMAQSLVGREAELSDWITDMVGGLLGLFGGSALLRLVMQVLRR